MELLNPIHVDNYLSAESYSCVFMAVILFPLLSPFGVTDNISSFKTLLYASLYLNKYYTDYYDECKKGDKFVHFVEDHKKTKPLTAFLSSDIRRELMCYTVS